MADDKNPDPALKAAVERPDSMVLERAIKVARTALSQYRTLGGE